ncbi:MAG: putative porin [Chitinophagia bacterium]|jgi:Putative porin
MSLSQRNFFLIILMLCIQFNALAQTPLGNMNSMMGGRSGFSGAGAGGTKPKDSLQLRDKNADSITIFYRRYNSNDIQKLDTTINDFFKHYPLPYTYYNLGNLGAAGKSYFAQPINNAGFDAGFHAYDTYNYTLEQTPFYQTTRPYTELGYLLGGKGEQLIEVKHTQNKKQQLNISFDYRFSNSPGNVKNQSANFNNMRITAHFQSKRKRYESYLVMITNTAASSENGGLIKGALLDSLSLNNPYELDTRLGAKGLTFKNPFNTNVSTGSTYSDNTFLLKQSYDLGQKDSIVKDTVTTYMFYPRLRFQNELKLRTSQYLFKDESPDSTRYYNYFNYSRPIKNELSFQDNWKVLTDEFSLISYPQKNNSNQFLQLGTGYNSYAATFANQAGWSNYDLYGFGMYKNKTRNQLWDMLASGKLFLNGYHAGDYEAKVYLSRILNSKGNYMKLAFQNYNRTPSANLLGLTQFPIIGLPGIKKENTLDFMGVIGNFKSDWLMQVNYQLINNYNYFSSGYQAATYSNVINYIRIQAENKVKLSTHWNWYNQWNVQIVDQASPIHVPLILTRQRIAFEGNFYKNLNLSTGLELIYHTEYKADMYMPLTGQFYTQNDFMLRNRPTANAFLHFMIKRFKAYIRLENLNTLIPTSEKLGPSYNFSAQNYPTNSLWFRVGIWWNFIN